MRKIRWIIGSLLILTACEKKVDITVPYSGDKIVVNSFVQPDSTVYIRVTRSQPPGSNAFPEVPDATVSLTASGIPVQTQWQVIGGRGYFVSRTPAAKGMMYRIQVSAAGLDTVSASDTLPRAPLLKEAFAQAGGNRVKFVLKDLPGKDFYRFRLYAAAPDNKELPLRRELFRFDPSYNNSFTDVATENFLETALVSDERFDGREITIVMQTQDVNMKDEHLILEVTSLTNASWQYLKTLELQTANKGNALVDLSRVYTNVVKGYGILGGVNAANLYIQIK